MNKRVLLALTAIVGLSLNAAGPVVLPCSLQLGPTASGAIAAPTSDWADGDETLHFDGDPDRGFSIRGTYSYGCAQRYTESTGVVVKAILYYLTGNADAIFVYTAGAGTEMMPGPMLDTTRASGLGGGVWKRANMPYQPAIEPYADFWACVIVRRHPSGQSPLTLDLGPIVPYRGGYITLPEIGPAWYQLTDPPFWTDRNVNIRAIVERAGSGVEEVISPNDPVLRHRLWPSPLRTVGQVTYQARQAGSASLSIYDVAGNLVRTLSGRAYKPSAHTLTWDCRADDGRRVSAGTYLYRLTANNQTVTGKAVVLD